MMGMDCVEKRKQHGISAKHAEQGCALREFVLTIVIISGFELWITSLFVFGRGGIQHS